MKKVIGIIAILIASIFSFEYKPIQVIAEETPPTTQFETIYPDNILGYANIDNITKFSISDKYIAYILEDNIIHVFDRELKKTTDIIADYSNVLKLKITSDKLIVADQSKIDILSLTTSSVINTAITFDVYASTIDIFCTKDSLYIGYISGKKLTINEYDISLHNLTPKNNYTSSAVSDYSSAFNLAINTNTAYIAIDQTNPAICVVDNIFVDSSTPRANEPRYDSKFNYSAMDCMTIGNQEYLFSFTSGILLPTLNAHYNNLDSVSSISLNPIDVDSRLNIVDINCMIEDDKPIIYVADRGNGAIQSYIIDPETNQIEKNSIMLCSHSSEVGRFNNVNNIYIQGDTLFLSDTNNNRIQLLQDNICTSIPVTANNSPKSVLLDNNLDMYFLTNTASNSTLNRYTLSKTGYVYNNRYNKLNDSTNLGLISDMTVGSNNLYLLDTTSNSILSYKNGAIFPFVNLEFNLTIDSKIKYLNEINTLLLYNEDTIYVIKDTEIKYSTTINDIKSLTVDLKHFYTLKDNSIDCYQIDEEDYSITKLDKNISGEFSSISHISFDIIKNTMYGYDNVDSKLVFFPCNITQNNINMINISEKKPVSDTSILMPITIKTSPIIFEYPYCLGKSYSLSPNNKNAIIIEETEAFYRILFNYEENLKSGYLKKEYVNNINNCTIETNIDNNTSVITINVIVPIYKYPTLLGLNSKPIIIGEIPLNTQLNLESEFAINLENDKDKKFYKCTYNGITGYIFNADIVQYNNDNITYLPETNASIRNVTDEEVILYDTNKITELCRLKNDDKILISKYDKNEKYTYIKYINNKQETIEGYVLTKYVKPDKIDNSTAIIIVILSISLVLLITLFVIYNNTKKKRK